MATRTFALVLGVSALTIAAGSGAAAAAPASSGSPVTTLACGDGFADLDHRGYDYTFADEAVNMFAGPHDACDVVEVADYGQRTDYHCYVLSGNDTWTYLRNVATGEKGWVNDADLTDGGSDEHC